MKTVKLPRFLLAPVALAVLSASPAALADPQFKFGGYVKSDLMVSDYDNGAPADNNLSRQFYVAGTIYGDPSRDNTVTDFHARETRFNFTVTDEIDGHNLKFFLEMDFFTTNDGNERVSNSYSPRLRHAFVSYDNWLAGQTWSTFQNPGALPEALDFVGAAEGTPFVRQAMIRYTSGPLQFAIENPKSTFTSAETGGRIESNGNVLPDFVARYNGGFGDTKYSFAALFRQASIDETVNDVAYDDDDFGYGLSAAMIVPVGERDMLKAMFNYADGAGRYIALNFANAAVLTSSGSIDDTIESYSGFASYQHWWSDKWRSNLTLSAFEADYPDGVSGNANETAYSGNVNLLYSPVKPITIGAEVLYAKNERIGDDLDDGELTRFQFSFKYAL